MTQRSSISSSRDGFGEVVPLETSLETLHEVDTFKSDATCGGLQPIPREQIGGAFSEPHWRAEGQSSPRRGVTDAGKRRLTEDVAVSRRESLNRLTQLPARRASRIGVPERSSVPSSKAPSNSVPVPKRVARGTVMPRPTDGRGRTKVPS